MLKMYKFDYTHDTIYNKNISHYDTVHSKHSGNDHVDVL